jgi:hypothetical protein
LSGYQGLGAELQLAQIAFQVDRDGFAQPALGQLNALRQSQKLKWGLPFGRAGAPAHSQAASAGFSARGAPAVYLTAEQAAAFSKQVERDLADKGARLAIVFRTGETRDMLPDGISYTHGAFWTFAPISLDDGRVINGYAVYNLYHGDGKTLAMDKSYLHQDFPIDFVAPSAPVCKYSLSPETSRVTLKYVSYVSIGSFHSGTMLWRFAEVESVTRQSSSSLANR